MTKTNALGILFQRKAIRVRTMKACPCLPLLMLPSRKARKLPLVLPPLVWHAFHTLRLRILRHFLCHKSKMNHFPTSIPTRQTSARWSGAAAPTINTQRPAQCSNSPTEETSCTTPTRDMPRLRAMRHFSPGVRNNDIPSGGRLLLRYTMGFREDRDVCSNPNM